MQSSNKFGSALTYSLTSFHPNIYHLSHNFLKALYTKGEEHGRDSYLINDSALNVYCEHYLLFKKDVSLFIIRRIGDAGFSEGFLALYAGAAAATMLVATTIARPGFCVIDAQFLASGCYLALCHVAVG